MRLRLIGVCESGYYTLIVHPLLIWFFLLLGDFDYWVSKGSWVSFPFCPSVSLPDTFSSPRACVCSIPQDVHIQILPWYSRPSKKCLILPCPPYFPCNTPTRGEQLPYMWGKVLAWPKFHSKMATIYSKSYNTPYIFLFFLAAVLVSQFMESNENFVKMQEL